MSNASAITALLHDAADRVAYEARTPAMDALAEAGAQFLREGNFTDEFGTPVEWSVPHVAIGYGVMLGWLAHEAAGGFASELAAGRCSEGDGLPAVTDVNGI